MDNFYSVLIILLAAAIKSGTPILYATLGEIITERSGVLNLGLEGIMLIGAFSGFIGTFYFENPYLGIIVAIVCGIFIGIVYSIFCISLRANQIVAGLVMVILGMGVSSYLGKDMIGKTITGLNPVSLPYLSSIPFLGAVLFNADILIYFSYIIVIITGVLLYKTKAGLIIRFVGDNPVASDTIGIDVIKVRYICVITGCILTSIGGAYLSIVYTHIFIENMTSGRGWIAIALVIFSSWDPYKAFLGAYLFGGINAVQLRIQAIGTNISPFILNMLPYIFTILVLIIASSKRFKYSLSAPGSLGIPFDVRP
ncbi:MAG: ABC transporter permease [Candidatus Hydrogenedentota bacterium]